MAAGTGGKLLIINVDTPEKKPINATNTASDVDIHTVGTDVEPETAEEFEAKGPEHVGNICILKDIEAAVACHLFKDELLQMACDHDYRTTRQPAVGTPKILKLKCLTPHRNKDFKNLIQELLSKIESLSRQEVTFNKNQWEKVVKFVKENKSQDVFLYYDPDGIPVVSILSRNFADLKTIRHRLQVELNIIKPSGKRDRKLAMESDGTEYSSASVGSTSVHRSSSTSDRLYPDLSSSALNSDTVTEFILDGKLLVKVYKGSITCVKVDSIVNAANDALAHAGGVARIIEEAAGYELTRESRKYIERHGNLNVGDVCLTTAGKMSYYKSVMHAVGPQWHMYTDKSKCLKDLDTTIYKVLIKADEMEYQKIAMPAISAGIFGVPKELCADMYVRAAVNYSREHKTRKTFLKEFHIVDIDTEILQCVKTSWEKWMNDPQDIDPENAVANYVKMHGSHDSSHGWGSGHRGRHNWQQFSSTVRSTRDHRTQWSDSQNRIKVVYKGTEEISGRSVQTFKIGKEVVIKIYRASLASVCQIDAVICGISSKGERGKLAKIVSEAAGKKYEKSFDDNRWKFQLKPGDILKCDPGNLQARYIIHVAIDRLQSTRESDLKSYRYVINHFLKEVDQLKDVKTMALPLLGSGGFDSPADLDHCCSAFLQAVLEFCSDQPKPNITEIHIVNLEEKVCTSVHKALHKVSTASDSDNSVGSSEEETDMSESRKGVDGTTLGQSTGNEAMFGPGQGKDKFGIVQNKAGAYDDTSDSQSRHKDLSKSRLKNNSGFSHGNSGGSVNVFGPLEFDDFAESRAHVHGSASGVPNVGSNSKKSGDQNSQIMANSFSGLRGEKVDTSTSSPDKKVETKGNLIFFN